MTPSRALRRLGTAVALTVAGGALVALLAAVGVAAALLAGPVLVDILGG